MVVLYHMQNGSYRLVELDSTVSNLRFSAFYLVPYHSQLCSSMPLTHLVDKEDLACANMQDNITQANPSADDI